MKTTYKFLNAAGEEVVLNTNEHYQLTQVEDVVVLSDGTEDEMVFTYRVVTGVGFPERPKKPNQPEHPKSMTFDE